MSWKNRRNLIFLNLTKSLSSKFFWLPVQKFNKSLIIQQGGVYFFAVGSNPEATFDFITQPIDSITHSHYSRYKIRLQPNAEFCLNIGSVCNQNLNKHFPTKSSSKDFILVVIPRIISSHSREERNYRSLSINSLKSSLYLKPYQNVSKINMTKMWVCAAGVLQKKGKS